jgi:hypothetical protein
MAILFYSATATPAIGGIDSYTKLMLHMDGDQSDSQHIVTANGNPQFSTAQSKFGDSSVYLNGASTLLLASSTDFNLGLANEPFTIDAWVKTSGNFIVFGRTGGADAWNGTTGIHYAFYYYAGTTLGFHYWKGAAASFTTAWVTATPINGNWNHLAVVYDGTTVKLYINGVTGGATSTDDFAQPTTTPANIRIGNLPSLPLTGYIDELRVSKGIARWTSDFSGSLPSAPYTPDANTKLLLHFDGDISTTPHTLTVNGNPQLNATTAKFNGAMYFDGSGDYVYTLDSEDFKFGSDDFTIDFWCYITQFAIDHNYLVGKIGNYAIGGAFLIGIDSGGIPKFLACSYFSEWDLALIGGGGSPISLNTWTHIAVTRFNSRFDIWVNGISTGNSSPAGSIWDSGVNLSVGACADGTGGTYGYIDELRISKGIARWTSNFTPESGPYTT